MILAIGRAERFSPNSVEKDTAILRCAVDNLRLRGHEVAIVGEDELPSDCEADAFLSMGRAERTLDLLRERRRKGLLVVNDPEAVALCCNRRKITSALRRAGLAIPGPHGGHGYWLKRGDGVAESAADVQFAANAEEARRVKAEMERRGMRDIMVSAHIVGDLVKFYGVRSTGFFRTFYPGDDGQWKFDCERHNGRPEHFLFNTDAMHSAAELAAQVSGTCIYGGDCIVESGGKFTIIDFNDWPSFARCREEAAHAIAAFTDKAIRQRLGGRHLYSNERKS